MFVFHHGLVSVAVALGKDLGVEMVAATTWTPSSTQKNGPTSATRAQKASI